MAGQPVRHLVDRTRGPPTVSWIHDPAPRLAASDVPDEALAAARVRIDRFSRAGLVLSSKPVGVLGARNRVYINIGLFSEEWLLHFNPLVGGKDVSPIRIQDGRKNSVYWQATEEQIVAASNDTVPTVWPLFWACPGGGTWTDRRSSWPAGATAAGASWRR